MYNIYNQNSHPVKAKHNCYLTSFQRVKWPQARINTNLLCHFLAKNFMSLHMVWSALFQELVQLLSSYHQKLLFWSRHAMSECITFNRTIVSYRNVYGFCGVNTLHKMDHERAWKVVIEHSWDFCVRGLFCLWKYVTPQFCHVSHQIILFAMSSRSGTGRYICSCKASV